MAFQKEVSDLLDELIREGNRLNSDLRPSKRYRDSYEVNDEDKLRRWSDELILFVSLMGNSIDPWRKHLQHNGYDTSDYALKEPLFALETIRKAADRGLLTSYENLIFAEAFADLYEQGQHLYSQGYFLAAGVVFRAVLEERLRRLCEQNDCMPETPRPTINDLNIALYRHVPPVYNKSVMQHVTALAGVGNDAAHNKPELTKDDVKRLQDGLLDFLARFKD